MNSRTSRHGLTLVELLVSISIIAVLIGLALGGVQITRQASLRAERVHWLEERRLGETGKRQLPIRVLFIGNSYTGVNDLPGMLRTLVTQSGTQPGLETAEEVQGGYTLDRHFNEGRALAKIRSGDWDFVVLQDQSQNPLPQYDPDNFREYAEKFSREIRERNAITLMYMTWAREYSPQSQIYLTRAYATAAKKRQEEVAPVGMAWERTRNTSPNVKLFDTDGSHPTVNGTWLAAITFYATIYDRSPAGLPYQLPGMTLSAADAQTLQTNAWLALKDVKKMNLPEWR